MASFRPSDHVDAERDADLDERRAAPNQPKLDFVGYLRFAWRQLTSMRTALLLLLLLAFAAVPGSLVPQRSADPNGVVQYERDNPQLFPILDALQVFDTYTSVWFSAIYLLLFVSLIGCVLPRTKHHWQALRSRPPKTPARFERLPASTTVDAGDTDAAKAIEEARSLLKGQRYRVEQYGDSVSAERGYLRETGNLVFHTALVGILIAVGIGGGFGYSGQKIVVEGRSFTNVLGNYDSFNPGRFFAETALDPYTLTLDDFSVAYEEENLDAYGQPIDFDASVTARTRDGGEQQSSIKVNEPLRIGGTDVFLLGNGYAPVITVRDGAGDVAFSQPVPFLPQDSQLTSVGVVKIPDGLDEQLGMRGFLYPTAIELESGALASSHPEDRAPTMTLEVYTGDLKLDDGQATSVYALDITDMVQIAGRNAPAETLVLTPGDTIELPDGLGSVSFDSLPRYISIDVHRDPSQLWVLLFALLMVAGLLTSLFVPRRRMWVKAVQTDAGVRLEYGGLARGEDPNLETAVQELAREHSQRLGLKVDR